jgi:hypothetical protein
MVGPDGNRAGLAGKTSRATRPGASFRREEGVCGFYITQKLGISAAATSTHLKILTLAGLSGDWLQSSHA